MIQHLLTVALCVYSAYGQTVDPSGPSYLELYTLTGQGGAAANIEEYQHDLSDIGFDDLTQSVCGVGVWLMYSDHSYNEHHYQNIWTEIFARAEYGCHDLAITRQGDMRSVRFAGTGDISRETMTLYHGPEYTRGEEMFIRDEDNIGDYTDEASSLVITGESAWTVYENAYGEGGVILCLEPLNIGGGHYAAWNLYDIGMPNNVVSAIRKGCFSETVLKYQPKN